MRIRKGKGRKRGTCSYGGCVGEEERGNPYDNSMDTGSSQ